MDRFSNPGADALIGEKFDVLDHGFVYLVDYMGGDDRIVQAARVSYGAGTKTKREDDALINYLLKNKHTSPFEQVVLTFHCKMPIFVARQWVRHRTARLNEVSGRYSVLKPEYYTPDVWRGQGKKNKQGSTGVAEYNPRSDPSEDAAFREYNYRLESGVARELARTCLPVSTYTEWYWQIDLHNLFHFLRLRLDDHAQLEIRVYGEAMAKIAKVVAPVAYAAFEEHILHSVTISRTEAVDFLAWKEGQTSR